MTVNQLRQALRTYSTRWSCRLIAVGWLCVCAHIPLLGFTHTPRGALAEELLEFMSLPVSANLFLGAMLGVMLKAQFADPRARLMPRFAVPHLIVAGAIIATAIGIQTALAPSWAGIGGRVALVSVAFLAIVAATWTFYSLNAVAQVFLLGLVFSLPYTRQYIVNLLQAVIDKPILSAGLGCVGLASLGALAARLCALSEESPEYSRRLPFRWDFTSSAVNRLWQRRQAEAIRRAPTQSLLLDLQFRFLLRGSAAAGSRRRVRLRRLAGGFSSLMGALVMCGAMASLLLMHSWTRKPVGEADVIVLSFMPMQLALGVLGGTWLRRWPFLARESLRPLGRRKFVRETVRSFAWDLAPSLAAHLAIIAAVLQLLPSQGRLDELLLPWLGLTAAVYVVAGCFLFWLVSYRNFPAIVLGVVPICGLSAAAAHFVLFGPAGFWSPVNATLAVAGTGLVAILIYRTAFRRWCSIDMA